MKTAILAGTVAGILALAGAAAAASAAPDERCARLEGRVAELRLKLRMGYGARQGRVWRQRLVALEAERRRLCRR